MSFMDINLKQQLQFVTVNKEKILISGEVSSGLMKQKLNCLVILPNVMFGRKSRILKSPIIPSQW